MLSLFRDEVSAIGAYRRFTTRAAPWQNGPSNYLTKPAASEVPQHFIRSISGRGPNIRLSMFKKNPSPLSFSATQRRAKQSHDRSFTTHRKFFSTVSSPVPIAPIGSNILEIGCPNRFCAL